MIGIFVVSCDPREHSGRQTAWQTSWNRTEERPLPGGPDDGSVPDGLLHEAHKQAGRVGAGGGDVRDSLLCHVLSGAECMAFPARRVYLVHVDLPVLSGCGPRCGICRKPAFPASTGGCRGRRRSGRKPGRERVSCVRYCIVQKAEGRPRGAGPQLIRLAPQQSSRSVILRNGANTHHPVAGVTIAVNVDGAILVRNQGKVHVRHA